MWTCVGDVSDIDVVFGGRQFVL